jgi:hypothetical protein
VTESDGGTFQIVESTPGWLRSQVVGHFDDDLCREVITAVDQWRGSRIGLIAFSDISHVEDYDVAARERISSWLRGSKSAFAEVHVLVNGRTIAWALKLVGMVSGANVIPYHSREAFLKAFERRVRVPIT